MYKKAFHLMLFLFLSSVFYAQNSQVPTEDISPRDFGKGFSYGISTLGLSVVGIPFRFSNGGNQIEAVLSYSPSVEARSRSGSFEIDNFTHGASLGLGYNLFLGAKNKSYKEKLIKNYIGFKGEVVSNIAQQVYGGITWRREAHKNYNKNASFGMDLGIGYLKGLGGDTWYNSGSDEYINGQVAIFFRLDWNWYKK